MECGGSASSAGVKESASQRLKPDLWWGFYGIRSTALRTGLHKILGSDEFGKAQG
jgi:hypothetical protein